MSDAVWDRMATACQIGVLQGICLGGLTGPHGASYGTHLQVGVVISLTEGDPVPPSILLPQPGYWRFRWALHTFANTIQVSVKQVANVAVRPSMVVKANPDCGVNADQSASAAGGAGWVTIGPITVTPSSAGGVYVEIHNNVVTQYADCFFKNLVVT